MFTWKVLLIFITTDITIYEINRKLILILISFASMGPQLSSTRTKFNYPVFRSYTLKVLSKSFSFTIFILVVFLVALFVVILVDSIKQYR